MSVKSTRTSLCLRVVMMLFLAGGPFQAPFPAAPATHRDLAQFGRAKITGTYGRLPLSFEANQGQVEGQVKFLSRGSGYSLFLTSSEAVLALRKPSAPQQRGQTDFESMIAETGDAQTTEPAVLRMQLVGANAAPHIVGLEELPGKVNYFIGNDPKKWQTNIPTYRAVLYKEVYPGIDIKFYGNNRQMEYDIIVKPGADPSKVQLAYDGIEGLRITENGDLEISLHSPTSTLTQKSPIIYQEIDGKRIVVEGRFKILRNHVIASEAKQSPTLSENTQFAYTFEVASYDKGHLLIIDPVLAYSTFVGGSGYDGGEGIAVDGSGNAYVTGWTFSSNFPTTSGAYDTTFNKGDGYTDVFILKLNAAGSFLTYATFIGGSQYADWVGGISVDGTGNAYIVGWTDSLDFPTTPGAFDTSYNGNSDVFVLKLNATGSSLTYSTFIGGSGGDSGQGITVDSSGNAYVTGMAGYLDFPVTPGAYDTSYNGNAEVFLLKLNATGAALSYSTFVGGSEYDRSYDIAVDISGNAYVTGYTFSSNFPATSGAYDTTYNGNRDGFMLKLDASGSSLYYATFIGGIQDEMASNISVDGSGNAYVGGWTYSPDFPITPGAHDTTYNGNGDAFVVKFDSTGSALTYSTFVGGSGYDDGRGISVHGSGNAYVTGSTNSPDFPTTPGAFDTTHNGNMDAFVLKLDSTGSTLTYSTYIGAYWNEGGYGIAVDSSGNAYVTGETYESNFPTTSGAYDITFNGHSDSFVAKISFPPAELPRTGQMTCYDSAGAVIPCAGTGQDGEIQAGVPWPSPRFTDNGDKTVTDNLTGLMWSKNVNLPGTMMTWQQALDYVAGINAGIYPNLGYTDWRLPNINELQSLIDLGHGFPAFPTGHPFTGLIPADMWFWSSTTLIYPSNAYNALAIRQNDGEIATWDKTFSATTYVWPVRGGSGGVIQLPKTGQTKCYNTSGVEITCAGTGQDGDIQAGIAWPSSRFTDHADGAVTDNLAGLMWTKDANPGLDYGSWQQALDYVAGMNAGIYPNFGYTDWRFPNKKELRSLLDADRNGHALPIRSSFYQRAE